MKYEEYEAAVNKIVTDPDTAPGGAIDLLKAIKEDLGLLETATASVREQAQKIDELKATNNKLFIAQTGPGPEKEPEEEEEMGLTELFEDAFSKKEEDD